MLHDGGRHTNPHALTDALCHLLFTSWQFHHVQSLRQQAPALKSEGREGGGGMRLHGIKNEGLETVLTVLGHSAFIGRMSSSALVAAVS